MTTTPDITYLVRAQGEPPRHFGSHRFASARQEALRHADMLRRTRCQGVTVDAFLTSDVEDGDYRRPIEEGCAA